VERLLIEFSPGINDEINNALCEIDLSPGSVINPLIGITSL